MPPSIPFDSSAPSRETSAGRPEVPGEPVPATVVRRTPVVPGAEQRRRMLAQSATRDLMRGLERGEMGETLALDMLQYHGADARGINPRTRDSVLHLAVRHGMVELTRALLERGAPLPAMNLAYETPLDLLLARHLSLDPDGGQEASVDERRLARLLWHAGDRVHRLTQRPDPLWDPQTRQRHQQHAQAWTVSPFQQSLDAEQLRLAMVPEDHPSPAMVEENPDRSSSLPRPRSRL